MNEVQVLRNIHNYPTKVITNMEETLVFFDMVPERTVSKKGIQEVCVLSSGAQKKILTVALSDGRMLLALAIFKGKEAQTPHS